MKEDEQLCKIIWQKLQEKLENWLNEINDIIRLPEARTLYHAEMKVLIKNPFKF